MFETKDVDQLREQIFLRSTLFHDTDEVHVNSKRTVPIRTFNLDS
jgi:hypothetical protein